MPDNTIDASRRTHWDPRLDDDTSAPAAPTRASAPPRDLAELPELPDTQSDLLARATRAASGRTEVHFHGAEAADALVDHVDATKARLDAFKAHWSPTYRLPSGDWVQVAAPFRMASTHRTIPEPNTALLRELGPRVGVSRAQVKLVQEGRGTPEQIRRLTQVLIQAGKLPAGPSEMSVGIRVRKMMLEYGIGIDCAGYVQQASAAARGVPLEHAGFRPIESEDLSRLESQGYRRVRIEDARAGDVVVLGPPKYENVGHRVIVAETRQATPAEMTAIAAAMALDKKSEVGSVKVYEVDSSWGSGGNPALGGVLRQTWFHDETHDVWLKQAGMNRVSLTPDGPYDHPLVGVYRPREAP